MKIAAETIEKTHSCPLCGGTMKWAFSVAGDWQLPESKSRRFDVWRCGADGFARVLPTPDRQELSRHYDLKTYYTRGGRNDLSPTSLFARLLEKVACRFDRARFGRGSFVDALPPGSGVTFLDIGCGSGKLLRRAAARGNTCFGVEPDPSAASRQPGFDLPVFEGTAEALPPEIRQRRYDAIVMVHVMEHVTEPTKAFSNLRDLLEPGGTAYIEGPNCACWDARLAGISWPHLEIPRHLNFWTAETLSRMAESVGLVVERISHVGYTRQFGAGWRRAGRRIAEFHRQEPWQRRLRGWPDLYGTLLFLLTAIAPERRKYDAAVVVVRRQV